jgi:DNA polymerase-3 subunit delta'
LAVEEIESDLAKRRPEWKPEQRTLVARLSEGALGRGRNFDLAAYVAARADAMTILNSAVRSGEHGDLFKVTETYRPGAEGREKTEHLLHALYSVLRDLMFLNSGSPELVCNSDLLRELGSLAEAVDFEWIAATSDRLAEVQRGMRRNLLRSLSLDAFAVGLERG